MKKKSIISALFLSFAICILAQTNLEIDKLDTINRIASGTFQFRGINNSDPTDTIYTNTN